MGDACVLCQESVEGKPLYKKLGSGEYNVDVSTALRALRLALDCDSSQNNYICWDCDELIVDEYGRYLENQVSNRKVPKQKAPKRQKSSTSKEQVEGKKKRKKKSTDLPPQVKKVGKLKLSLSKISQVRSPTTKKREPVQSSKINNAYHSTHCVFCDKSFENEDRGCQQFNLKKMVNDEMDVAQVMELLGLARHIAPEMKKKRFVCSPCYYSIRRNYKNKLSKGTSVEGIASSTIQKKTTSSNPIHRATTQEHAAEIAKLLPPALAECYKILTEDCRPNTRGELPSATPYKSQVSEAVIDKGGSQVYDNSPSRDDPSEETEVEEDDTGFNISQDEYGNYFIQVEELAVPKVTENINQSPGPTPNKKNVLLPKRRQHHLSKDVENDEQTLKEGKPGVANMAGICNICGIPFNGKPASWWYNLYSMLAGFENITVKIALRLLETSLAVTSQDILHASHVCPMCYGMVSAGFRSQVTQRIERKMKVDPSQVNISKMKIQVISKQNVQTVQDVKDQYASIASSDQIINKGRGRKRKIINDHHSVNQQDQICNGNSGETKIEAKKRKNLPEDSESHLTNESTGTKVLDHDPADKEEDKKKQLPLGQKKPMILLKDLRSVLPVEVFGGRTVSAQIIEQKIGRTSAGEDTEETPKIKNYLTLAQTDADLSKGIFSSLSYKAEPKKAKYTGEEGYKSLSSHETPANDGTGRGRCVICGCNYYVQENFWQNIDTPIRPPNLLVSVRWVCISLNVVPVEVTPRDQELGQVCKYCFVRLSKQFTSFVRGKVGESCGLSDKKVSLNEYVVTFNPTTMKIEVDPVETHRKEQEEMSELLGRILPLFEWFSTDDLVSQPHPQPLEPQDFTILMLVVLNDFRVQIGASIEDLVTWLTQLMPREMFNKGLRPCQDRLASYLLTLSKDCGNLTNKESTEVLPEDIFVLSNSEPPHHCEDDVQHDLMDDTDEGESSDTDLLEEDHWDNFLKDLSLDEIINESPKPLSISQFTNGVVYALWKTSQMVGDSSLFTTWLTQISPIVMSTGQADKMEAQMKLLHSYLERSPENIYKLQRPLISCLRPNMELRVSLEEAKGIPISEECKKEGQLELDVIEASDLCWNDTDEVSSTSPRLQNQHQNKGYVISNKFRTADGKFGSPYSNSMKKNKIINEKEQIGNTQSIRKPKPKSKVGENNAVEKRSTDRITATPDFISESTKSKLTCKVVDPNASGKVTHSSKLSPRKELNNISEKEKRETPIRNCKTISPENKSLKKEKAKVRRELISPKKCKLSSGNKDLPTHKRSTDKEKKVPSEVWSDSDDFTVRPSKTYKEISDRKFFSEMKGGNKSVTLKRLSVRLEQLGEQNTSHSVAGIDGRTKVENSVKQVSKADADKEKVTKKNKSGPEISASPANNPTKSSTPSRLNIPPDSTGNNSLGKPAVPSVSGERKLNTSAQRKKSRPSFEDLMSYDI